ncbi:LysM peptidoglycan-binding domain-containing protein [Clostridium sp.]|uniref:LysM peptidoglycan-binding domain-containing protein n=1 Tax=Clostridium sp. TaxID=1506 RepID=UPI0032174258
MKFKKQVIIAISCVVVLGGIFFAVSYIGNRDQASKESKNNTVKITDTTTKEKTNSKLTEDETNSTIKPQNKQKDDGKNTNEETSSETGKEAIKEGYYVVKKNDTLYSIARNYMPKSEPSEVVETILKRNNMSKDEVIAEGQKLIISYETALESKDESDTAKVNATEHTEHTKYVIKSGDTLYSIAKEYLSNMDIVKGVDELKSHNNIKDVNAIKVNDSICIPSK